MKGQSKLGSFIESMINILVGFWINFLANIWVLPLFGFHITVAQNLQIGLIYTGISIVRSYVLRRGFNWYHIRKAL